MLAKPVAAVVAAALAKPVAAVAVVAALAKPVAVAAEHQAEDFESLL